MVTSPACATGNAPKPYHSSRYAPRISEAQAFIIHQGEAYASPFFFGIASAFAEQGASLFITGRTEGRLADAAEKLKGEYGADVAYTVAEGSDEAQVEAAVAKCVEHFGKLDVMVNNAQASKSGTNLIDHTKEDFDLAINTGLYGAFFYMKHAFPELKKKEVASSTWRAAPGLFAPS